MPEKEKMDDLAIFEGTPTFDSPLFVGYPNIGDRDQLLDRINNLLDRRWLTNAGVYVQELEKRIADFLRVKHCIAMCNGTVALEIAIRATELTGEVIVPSLTFVATAHALQWQEITPIFCDIDPDTYTIDPNRVESLITPRTTGLIGVHLWGRPCDVDALTEIADKNKLKLLFDAAHAFSCTHQRKRIGCFGNAEVFSFHATKFVNTFEGGAVTTNDDALAEKMRLMKNFGFAGYDNVIYIGTNGKMSEVSAAMGLTSLESREVFIDRNRHNYLCYKQGLSGISGIRLMEFDETEELNYQYIVVEIDPELTNIQRDDIIDILHAENVIARRYFYPGCHNMEPYRSFQPHSHFLLPITERVASRVLVLPTGSAAGENDIQSICSLITLITGNGQEISSRLRH